MLKKSYFCTKLITRMLEKTLGIVLHIIPYNDKVAVAHLYTREYGRMAFLFPQGNGRKARYDYRKCIRCYCCQEMCPAKAISVRRGPLARLLERK